MADIPLDAFTGAVNENIAHVYVRLPTSEPISGYVRGPFNALAETLPSTTPVVDLGPGEQRLGQAIVIDPCTWSPQSPSTYQVHVDLHEHDCFGIRRFGAAGNRFYLDGKRFVVRGIFDAGLDAESATWRRASAARVLGSFIESPGRHEVLRQSTRLGVLVIVRLEEKTTSFPLKTIADYACSPLVVLPENADLTRQHRSAAPNLLFAQRLERHATAAEWADAIWLEFEEVADFARRIHGIQLPIIAVRRGQFDSLSEARAAIDTLQADLAPIGQFAGYVV